MPIVELYSQRRRRELASEDDVFQYEIISPTLRRQLLYILSDALGAFGHYDQQDEYEYFVETLRREFGVTSLTGRTHNYAGQELELFIQSNQDNERALDALELCFRYMAIVAANKSQTHFTRQKYSTAIQDFNARCKQSGLGYAFENGILIRIDSTVLHAEAVKPALAVLSDPEFQNANTEFRNAHEHWRQGKGPEVLVDCLKAFESTMKVIATKKSWTVPDRPTASQLVQVMLDNQLIPAFYQTQMAGLRSVLESGIPTPRNRAGGHGAGAGPATPVPAELVRYVLHLTAATILFLVDAYKSLS